MRTFNEYNTLHDKSAPVFNKMHKKVIFGPVMTRCLSSLAQIISFTTLVSLIAPYVCIYGKKGNNHLQFVQNVSMYFVCCIIVLFDAFSNAEVAGNIFSFDEIFLCCNVSCGPPGPDSVSED